MREAWSSKEASDAGADGDETTSGGGVTLERLATVTSVLSCCCCCCSAVLAPSALQGKTRITINIEGIG